ncbi:MAG: hypothetical protein JXA57_19955 [Armatimonadetes bacterium]|nr:hypothetical protein [Armatimonadota bacterium]
MAEREELIRSYDAGNFLEVLYASWMNERADLETLVSQLVALHNEGVIDLVAAYEKLENTTDGPEFFSTRHLFEKALPELNASVPAVMQCVRELYTAAGQDFAAGTVVTSLFDFCKKDAPRLDEALAEIEAHYDEFAQFLFGTLVAGSETDFTSFLAHTLRLCRHDNVELRSRALCALSRLAWPRQSAIPEAVVEELDHAAATETDDRCLASVVSSGFSLLEQLPDEAVRIVGIVDLALSRGGDYTLHAAAKVFGLRKARPAGDALQMLLRHLRRVAPTNNGMLDLVDLGISDMVKQGDSEAPLGLLECLLLAHPDSLTMESFDGVAREIAANKSLLGKVLTRWFLKGEQVLCEAVGKIVDEWRLESVWLDIDATEVEELDPARTLFVARKAVGYLFVHPVTVSSVIVSLMRCSGDEQMRAELGGLLLNPVLVNYPGETRSQLEEHLPHEPSETQNTLAGVLQSLDDYLDNVRSVGELAALHPSERHREMRRRRETSQAAEIHRAAIAKSVFLSMVSKSTLLYGRKSVNYRYEVNGEASRTEMPLQTMSVEAAIPRMIDIDPVGLDYQLRVYRVERLRT